MNTNNICFCEEIKYQYLLIEKSVLSGAVLYMSYTINKLSAMARSSL